MSDNPLFLRDPADCCPSCGTYLRPNGDPHTDLKPCPMGCRDEVCLTCEGSGEVFAGKYEHDTGAPITGECRDCWGTGERR